MSSPLGRRPCRLAGSQRGSSARDRECAPSSGPALQSVVAELLARLVQTHTLTYSIQNLAFGALDFFGRVQDVGFVGAWNHDHPIRVTSKQIARSDPGVADRHRFIDGFDLNAIFARAHPMVTAIDRVAQSPA